MLPARLQLSMKHARRGSYESMKEVVQFIATNTTAPNALHILPTFFHVLSSSKFFIIATNQLSGSVMLLVKALEGIAVTAGCLPDSEAVVDRFLEGWQYVWPWVSFVAENSGFGAESFGPAFLPLRFAIIRVLEAYTSEMDLRAVLMATPGAFSAVTQMWMEHTEPVNVSEAPEPLPSPSRILELLVRENCASCLEKMITVADQRTIVTTALRNLRSSLRLPHDYRNINANIILLRHLGTSGDLIPLLISRRAVGEVAKAMLILTSSVAPWDDTISMSADVPCISNCIVFLERHIVSGTGFTAALQAIRAGILEGILRTCGWAQHPVRVGGFADCRICLLKRLLPYLIYCSALPAVRRSLDQIETLGLEAGLHPQSSLHDAWYQFKQLALERVAISQVKEPVWESLWYPGLGPYYICNNTACEITGKVDLFRRCSACREAYYCDKECQRQDWRQGKHREECRGSRSGSAYLSRSDRKFIFQVMLNDVRARGDAITEEHQTRFHGAPFSSLLLHCDYQHGPVSMTLRKHTTSATGEGLEDLFFTAIVAVRWEEGRSLALPARIFTEEAYDNEDHDKEGCTENNAMPVTYNPERTCLRHQLPLAAVM